MKSFLGLYVWFLVCLVATGWNIYRIVLDPTNPFSYIFATVTAGFALYTLSLLAKET